MTMIAEQLTTSPWAERIASVGRFIGGTPLFPITRLISKPGVQVYAKLEWQQLGASVKARPAFNIVREAVLRGELHEGKRLLDASSGNTGIAYAAVGAALGLGVTICLPENASEERKLLLKAYGAEIIYTSRFGGTDEAQEKALVLATERPDLYWYADQYANDSNWRAHYLHTAEEIWAQTQGQVSHFITGLGTSGTFMGTSRKLQELNPEVRLISQQPDGAMHGLEGWKHMPTAKVPKIYDQALAHENRAADTMEAFGWVKRAAQEEGLMLSPSSAANLMGAIKLAQEIDQGVVVTVFPDNADKYGEIMREIFK